MDKRGEVTALRNLILPREPESFNYAFNSLTKEEKKLFENKILDNKFSTYFLEYTKKNGLLDSFNKTFLEKASMQSTRLKIHALELAREILQINKLLLKHGFEPIFLKGAALLIDFNDFSTRSTSDIDILLPENQLYEAYNLLIKNNYLEHDKTKGTRNKKNIEYLTGFSHQIPALRGKNNLLIDLHHRVTRPRDFKNCPVTYLFHLNKRKINFFKGDVFIPSRNEMFLHVIINFSLNNRLHNSLRCLEDIKKINHEDEIKIQEIYSITNNRKIIKAVSLVLNLLNELSLLSHKQSNYLQAQKKFRIQKSIIDHASSVVFSLKKTNPNYLIKNKLDSASNYYEYLKIVLSRVFISTNEIAYLYKTPHLNAIFICYIYVRNILVKGFASIKIFFAPFVSGKNNQDYENNSLKIERWLND